MDGKRNRENIYPVLNLHGYVWTGPKFKKCARAILDSDNEMPSCLYTIHTIICLRFTLPDAQIFSHAFIKNYNQAF